MSSFNKTHDFRNYNNYIIKPFNNKYFIYENKYLIRYEYYNIILNYIKNQNIYNHQYILNNDNKKKNFLQKNKKNDDVNDVSNLKNNTQIIIKDNENIDNKQINKKNQIYTHKKNYYDYSKKSFQEYYQEKTKINSNQIICNKKKNQLKNDYLENKGSSTQNINALNDHAS